MNGLQRWTVEESLHRLERKEFVRRERRSSVATETEYAFRHVLVRDVAYGQVPRALRAEKHRLAAEWIEALSADREDRAEMLAHHYLSALEFARAAGQEVESIAERARVALREAGDRAYTLSAFRRRCKLLPRSRRALAFGRSGARASAPPLRQVALSVGLEERRARASSRKLATSCSAPASPTWHLKPRSRLVTSTGTGPKETSPCPASSTRPC